MVLSRPALEKTIERDVRENSEKVEIEVALDEDVDLKQESWCTVEQQCVPSPRSCPILEWNGDDGDDHETKATVRFGTFVYQVVSRQGVTVYPNVYRLGSSMEEDSNGHHQNTSCSVIEDERDDKEDARDRYQPMLSPRKKSGSMVVNYAQMIQVDQVVQTNTVNKDDSNTAAVSSPRVTIVRNPTEIVRLAHGEGWTAAEWYGRELLQALPVEMGLWCWYVHYNCTDGLVSTRHPMRPSMQQKLNDQNENSHNNGEESILLPLQKIYCDAKVVNDNTGQTFYRLQTKSSLRFSETQKKKNYPLHMTAIEQATPWNGWICDTTMQGKPTLLPEEQVRMDVEMVICNRGKASLPVYPQPRDEKHRTLGENKVIMTVIPGEMVAVKTTVWTQKSETITAVENVEVALGNTAQNSVSKDNPNKITVTKSQPSCMQLADRSGWVVVPCASTTEGEIQTQEVHVCGGNWKFRVMHEQGIKSYTHPSAKSSDEDNNDNTTDFYPYASILQCDSRVTHPVTGRTYYRLHETGKWIPGEHESAKLEGTDLWVLGNGGSHPWLAELAKTLSPPEVQQGGRKKQKAWSPDFVSGIAATVDGLNELDEPGPGGSLLFEADGGIRIQIFCAQRSVDTEIRHKVIGNVRVSHLDCTAKDLQSILQKDPMEFVSSIDTIDINGIRVGDRQSEKEDARAENEKDLRHELLCCDSDIDALLKKRRNLVNQLAIMDGSRQLQLLKEMSFSVPGLRAVTEKMTSPRIENEVLTSLRAGNQEPLSERFDEEGMPTPRFDDASASLNCEDYTRGTNTTNFRHFNHNVSESALAESASTDGSDSYYTRTTQGSGTNFTQRETATSVTRSSRSGESFTVSQSIYTEANTNGSSTMEEERDDPKERSEVGTIYEKKNSDQSTTFGKSRQLSHTCGECSKAFLGKYSRDLHCRQVHRLFCSECDKIFPSFAELNHHKAEEKHM